MTFDDWTHQRVTLGNLVILLGRIGAYEEAAMLLAGLDADRAHGVGADDLVEVRQLLRKQLGRRFDQIASGVVADRREAIALALDTVTFR